MAYTEIILSCRINSGVLALGAQSKSGFCFAKGKAAYLSELFGDLSDLGNFKKFEREVKKLQGKLKIKPKIIACDLHPEYITTKYANNWLKAQGSRLRQGFGGQARLKGIQHHEAHVASCMVDNNIKGRVIGVAFDGAGFGSDGNIWGGEFFIGGLNGFKRVAHLKYVPMPGGEASIKEPWRMAFSYMYSIYGKERLASLGELGTSSDIASSVASSRPFFGKGGASPAMTDNNDILSQMIDKKINSPLTSSMGRLFDGVSSLIGVCDFAGFEGEAAVRLEKIIEGEGCIPHHELRSGTGHGVKGGYKFKYTQEGEMIIVNWEPVIRGVVKDLRRRVKKPEISLKFHNAICNMIKEVCVLLRKRYRINKVCLSGGVFQNKYISGRIGPVLAEDGFKAYRHDKVPAHDGGIALGQAILATTPTA